MAAICSTWLHFREFRPSRPIMSVLLALLLVLFPNDDFELITIVK